MDSDVGGEEGGQNERNHTLGLLPFMLAGIGRDSRGNEMVHKQIQKASLFGCIGVDNDGCTREKQNRDEMML